MLLLIVLPAGPQHSKVVRFLKIYFDELKNEFKRK